MTQLEIVQACAFVLFWSLAGALAWGRKWKRRARQLEGAWPLAEAVEPESTVCHRCGHNEFRRTYLGGWTHRCVNCGRFQDEV